MSTNSFIAYKENDVITGIYCHWDGYLEYNGDMLKTFYTKDRAKALMELGDISSLNSKISKDEPDFEPNNDYSEVVQKYLNKVTEAYHRDKGEDWEHVKPRQFKSLYELRRFIVENGYLEFAYLFNADNDDTAPYNTWTYITPEYPDKFETF